MKLTKLFVGLGIMAISAGVIIPASLTIENKEPIFAEAASTRRFYFEIHNDWLLKLDDGSTPRFAIYYFWNENGVKNEAWYSLYDCGGDNVYYGDIRTDATLILTRMKPDINNNWNNSVNQTVDIPPENFGENDYFQMTNPWDNWHDYKATGSWLKTYEETIFVENKSSEELNAYAYGGARTTNWPGVHLTEGPHGYSYFNITCYPHYKSQDQTTTIILNNGTQQTDDIVINKEDCLISFDDLKTFEVKSRYTQTVAHISNYNLTLQTPNGQVTILDEGVGYAKAHLEINGFVLVDPSLEEKQTAFENLMINTAGLNNSNNVSKYLELADGLNLDVEITEAVGDRETLTLRAKLNKLIDCYNRDNAGSGIARLSRNDLAINSENIGNIIILLSSGIILIGVTALMFSKKKKRLVK